MVPSLILACVGFSVSVTSLASDPDVEAVVGRMLQQLNEKDWILRAEALTFLGDNRNKDALERCQEILADEATGPWLRGRALVAIAQINGSSAIKDVRGFVRHQHPDLRAAAADAFDTLSDSDVVGGEAIDESIRILLNDKDLAVRFHALAAHAHRHGERAWSVVDGMTRSVDGAVYEPATRALAHVATDAALERLNKLAGQEPAKVIRGLAGVVDPKLLPLLLRVLGSVSPDSNEFALILTIFQRHKREDLLAALGQELKGSEPSQVRTAALVMTRLVSDPDLGDRLRGAMAKVKDTRTIRDGLTALGSRPMQPDRHKRLFEAHLDHNDVAVRALAIRCLAHCESVNQFTLLEDRVTDKSLEVVYAALGSLLEAPVQQAPRGRMVAYLQSPLQSDDEETRAMAFRLLGQAGTEDDFQPALALLTERLRGTDEARRSAAAEALGRIAPADAVVSVVRTQGYVANWMVLGTFLNDEKNSGFDIAYPPEKEIDYEKKYQAKYVWALDGRRREGKGEIEREIEWAEGRVDQTDGKLLLAPLVPPPGALVVAYAVADFTVESDREVVLNIDGDDAFRVWLNGEKIAESVGTFAHRKPVVAASYGNKIKLKSGMNRFLVKTTNIGHEWWVRLRLTDGDGRPVEVRGVVR